MQPYELTYNEWIEGLYFQKELTNKEKSRVLHKGDTSPDTGFTVQHAELDGRPIFSIKPEGDEPLDSESQKRFGWTKIIPTGRKYLSEEQHRDCVAKALMLGRNIPPHVLASYPEFMSLQGTC